MTAEDSNVRTILATANDPAKDYHALNAMLNLYDPDGKIQFGKDKEAERAYVHGEIEPNMRRFGSTRDRIDWLVENKYYDGEVFSKYGDGFLDSFYRHAGESGFEFETFLGAFKFYRSYALKSFDGSEYLEDFPQRCAAVALALADGSEEMATEYLDEMLSGRFQPATPTFLNLGKAQRGEAVSCFLLRVEDNMESISRGINGALQLSKRGGGVALLLSNLRELGAPIKHIENQSSGVIPVMKLLEDSFSYANQLGARQGAGAVYLSAHHPDILRFLDTKRENADEKIRIKTLALGVVIPDITFELAKQKARMALFSPYDVERVYGKPFADISITEHYDEMVADDRIRKTYIDARKFFTTIAELQFESGYPYIVFEDTVNRANPIEGRVTMSNLCVTGDTKLLTDRGYVPIKQLHDEDAEFDVVVDERARLMDMNASGLSTQKSTKAILTKKDAPVLRLIDSNGHVLTATPWHKMYVIKPADGVLVKIPLAEVEPGDSVLIAPDDESSAGTTSRILAIEPAGTADVYDVTVDNGHSVVFNGIATGNCSEILQVQEPSEYNEDLTYRHVGRDISCNLGSLNIAKAMDGGLGRTVETAIRALTSVAEHTSIDAVPSIRRANEEGHAIGLGQMNLHGFLAREGVQYGSEEGLDFTDMYFMTVAYHAYKASHALAVEHGRPFASFPTSDYAKPAGLGNYFDKYTDGRRSLEPRTEKVRELFRRYGITIPTVADWKALRDEILRDGIYNQNLQAVPPTGSISYINHSTSSIHPIASKIEIRKEGKLGRVYYPAPFMRNDNLGYYRDAYEIGWKAIVDMYAEATQHVDQGLSLTLFFPDTATTRDLNKAQIYAWRKGIKTLYYIRIRQQALEGTEVQGCVSCML